jgi:polysaccharide biosynthesis transport protein
MSDNMQPKALPPVQLRALGFENTAPMAADFATRPEANPLEPGFVEYWRMFCRRKGVMFVFVMSGIATALGLALLRNPLYEGHIAVELQDSNADFLNMRALDPTAANGSLSPDGYVATQARILESRSLIAEVVDRLKIAESADFQTEKGIIRMLRATGLPFETLPWFRRLTPREKAIDEAIGSLRVKTAPQSRIIDVHFDWTDPKTAADFANALGEAFVLHNVEARWSASQRAGDWLGGQLGSTRAKLESLEAELQSYASRVGLLFTSDKESVADEKLRQLQAELSKAQADRMARQSSYEIAITTGPEALPEALDSQQLNEYQLRLSELRRQFAELNLTLTPTHYRIVRLKAQIDELERTIARQRGNISNRIVNEFTKARTREQLLTEAYQAQARVVFEQAARRAHYNVLQREVETNRRIYDGMLEKVRDAGVAAAIRASNVRIVDPATPASRPSQPKLPVSALAGMFSGFGLGAIYILVRERTNRKVQGPDEIFRYLGTQGLGAIPSGRLLDIGSARVPQMLPLSGGRSSEPLELITWKQSPSALAESFRSVLASLLYNRSGNGERSRTIVVTSPAPQEGKTTVISNLAIAHAELNQRVVIVDCDLRRPRMHVIFNLTNSWGVSDLVSGDVDFKTCPLEALVQSTEIPRLRVVASGPGPSSVANILNAERMKLLLERLRSEFDTVLIDTPPVLPFADARILGHLADGMILVLRANRTDREEALASVQRLNEDGVRILGAVLNDWDPKNASYGYRSYGYQYN